MQEHLPKRNAIVDTNALALQMFGHSGQNAGTITSKLAFVSHFGFGELYDAINWGAAETRRICRTSSKASSDMI